MKKTWKLALCGLMLAGAMNAQVATLPNDYESEFYTGWHTLPRTFSTDGTAKLLSSDISEEGGNGIINIYNSSFNIEHSFEIVPQVFHWKHVVERRAYVEVPGRLLTADFSNYGEEWLNWWNNADRDEKISFVVSESHYNSKIFGEELRYDYPDSDSIYTDDKGDIYSLLFKEYYDYISGNYFKHTIGYFVISGTTAKFQYIDNKQTGEWVVSESETRESESFNYTTTISHVVNIDDDLAHELERPLIVTQNIFNTDEKYEYIKDKYTTYSNRLVGEEDTDGDGITDVRAFESGREYAGFEIVSEDGNVIASFNATDDNYGSLTLIQWEGKRYLGFSVYDDDEGSENFHIYKINPNGSGITRASSTAFMHILPAMPKKNTSVTVEFGEESVKKGGQLMITDMNGRTVYRNAVAPGETSVRVPLRRMESGVYNVTLTNDGKKVETSKLIVR